MRSRPARLTLSALALAALGAAAFFAFQSEQQITSRRTSLRAFEATTRDATDALADLQAGQQAYIAVGQDAAEWAPKVATYLQTAASSLDTLRSSAASPTAAASLLDASSTLTELTGIDRRVRANIEGNDLQVAAGLIFSDGAEAIARAVSGIDTAAAAERQAADAEEARLQRAATYAAGGAAAFCALVLAVLGLANPRQVGAEQGDDSSTPAEDTTQRAGVTLDRSSVTPVAAPPDGTSHDEAAAVSARALSDAAALCTDFGRVREAADLKPTLERAAAAMNARGVIVWLGNSSGADLRPVLAHGYSEQTLARIPSVARTADNAAAAAYRTGEVQVVRSRPGASQGAVVAPLLVADGCIGALTAEIRDRGEETPAVMALASIVASQLAAVLAASAAEQTSAPPLQSAAGT